MTRNFLYLLLFVSTAAFGEGPTAPKPDPKEGGLYSSFGKRDPFRAPERGGLGRGGGSLSAVRKYRLESYHLRAILRIGSRPQAMFEDPDGKSHVVVEGELIGIEGARVSRIVQSEVIVTERGSNNLGKETLLEKVISLPADSASGGSKGVGPAGTVQQEFPQTKEGDGNRLPSGEQALELKK
jgi:Tfp pilus assembly protein PilP